MLRWISNLLGRTPPRNTSAMWQQRYAALKAKYDAAQTNDENRKHWGAADALSARAANSLGVRKKLRERARYEVANNGYCGGLVLTLANDLVGTGPTLHVQHANASTIETAFWNWADAVGLAEKLHTAKQAKTRDGEAFLRLTTNPTLPNPVQLDLQAVECDQVTDPRPTTDTFDGVRLDRFGNPESYIVLANHPGDMEWNAPGAYETVPASQILHWFRADRPGQIRGVPEITASLPLYSQLRRYTLGVLRACEVAADMGAAVLETAANADTADGPTDEDEFDTLNLERGMLTVLPAGTKLSQLEPEQPTTTYDQFVRNILREAGRPTNAPLHVILGDASSYNYSSARLDHILYRSALDVEREHCRRRVLDRVFAAWLAEAVLIPELGLGLQPGEPVPHSWTWPGFATIDPQKEAAADTERLKNKTATLAQILAKDNLDWEEQLEQVAREQERMKELGLVAEPVEPAEPAAPKPDDADDVDARLDLRNLLSRNGHR